MGELDDCSAELREACGGLVMRKKEAEAGRVWGGALLCGGVAEDGLSEVCNVVSIFQSSIRVV